MALLPAGDNAPEITQRRFAHCADIKMNKQKYYDQETKNHMELVREENTAEPEEFFQDKFRKHQRPPRDKKHRQGKIHHDNI